MAGADGGSASCHQQQRLPGLVFITAAMAAYRKGSQLGQSVTLTVPQYIGAYGVAVQLRFEVPVRYSCDEQKSSPSHKDPRSLELHAERGGQVSGWRQ
jgi:hypothetical protein